VNRRTFLKYASLSTLGAGRARAKASLNIGQLTASTASFAGMSLLECFEAAQRLKFGGVEILTFSNGKHSVGAIPGAVVSELSAEDRRKALASLRGFRHITTHLPFYGQYPAALDPAKREITLQTLRTAIEDSGYWGASVATIHAMIEPGRTYAESRADLVSVLRGLGDHAAKHKLRLGVENGAGGPNTVDGYLDLVREVNHPAVGGTVDTGHVIAYKSDLKVPAAEYSSPSGMKRYNDVLLEVVKGLGPKLFHFHVDDVKATTWREHRSLGTGIVDWRRLLGFLSDTGYTGLFALELEETPPVDSAATSREFFAQILRSL
jgi:sugar phosphate isomerase/epimerase